MSKRTVTRKDMENKITDRKKVVIVVGIGLVCLIIILNVVYAIVSAPAPTQEKEIPLAFDQQLLANRQKNLREQKALDRVPAFRELQKRVVVNTTNVTFQLVKFEPYGDEMTGVQVKVTNIGGRHIHNCLATCILRDSAGVDLAFAKHYVIKSIEGGLGSGCSTYFEYVLDASYKRVSRAIFHIEHVNYE